MMGCPWVYPVKQPNRHILSILISVVVLPSRYKCYYNVLPSDSQISVYFSNLMDNTIYTYLYISKIPKDVVYTCMNI